MKAKKLNARKVTPKRIAPKRSAASSYSTGAHTAIVKHSKHGLSDTTLLLLALFFSVAALFVVLLNKQQTENFQRYMNSQMLQRDSQYVPGTEVRN